MDQASQVAAQLSRMFPGIVIPYVNPLLGIIPGEIQNKPKQWFVYTPPTTPQTIAASQQNFSFPIQIQNDSYFVLMALTGIVTLVDNVTVQDPAPLTLQVNDSGSGANWFFGPTQWSSLVGTGKEPGVTNFPRIINPAATLTVSVNNLVATAFQFGLQFCGFKIYHLMADLTS